MKVDRKKLELAMARACMTSAELPAAAGIPRPTVQNAVVGKSVRPATLGRIARALKVDPAELLEEDGSCSQRQTPEKEVRQ
jgi:DNA-binding Xre family transcriptional regulator